MSSRDELDRLWEEFKKAEEEYLRLEVLTGSPEPDKWPQPEELEGAKNKRDESLETYRAARLRKSVAARKEKLVRLPTSKNRLEIGMRRRSLHRRRASGRGRPNSIHRDTSVKKQEPDPTPVKDFNRDFAGLKKLSVGNEPEAIPLERWEEPLPNPNMMGLDEYENWAAKNIEGYGHPAGRQAQIDDDLRRQSEITNLEWILQEPMGPRVGATAISPDLAPLALGNPGQVSQALTSPLAGSLVGSAVPGLLDPADPMRPVWCQLPSLPPPVEDEREVK